MIPLIISDERTERSPAPYIPLRDRRSERLTRHDRERLAARRAAAPQGWREQAPADRTQVVKVPNRTISVRKGSRWDWPSLAAFALTVALLVWGMSRPEKPAAGGQVTVSNNKQVR